MFWCLKTINFVQKKFGESERATLFQYSIMHMTAFEFEVFARITLFGNNLYAFMSPQYKLMGKIIFSNVK